MCTAARAGLALFAVGLAIDPAAADPIVFENTGGAFHLRGMSLNIPPTGEETFLDITQPASQSGEAGPLTFTHYFKSIFTSSDYYWWYFQGAFPSGTVTFAHGETIDVPWPGNGVLHPPRIYLPGEAVGQEDPFQSDVDIFYRHNLSGWTRDLLPARGYLGLNINGHYGWVEFERLTMNWGDLNGIQVLAWGYETEAGVPIVVPAPAGAGLFGLMVVAAAGRRRRAERAAR